MAGLSFMTETQIDSVADWGDLGTREDLFKIAPGILLGIGMFVALRYVHHVLTLPGTLGLSVVVFYLVLFSRGLDLSQAQSMGWVAPPVPPTPFYEAWELLDVRLVRWETVPLLVPSWVALTLVVAFSSSLDVTAIEMEKKQPLEYDYELQMIGLSNLVSGLTGGFTGSYIFSQTIFNLRRGITTRVCSATIASIEFLAFLLPVSLIAFVPRFFFGGLLVLIGTDLMLEWLWMSRKKMMAPEYAVTVATFLAIQVTNIEVGMGVGVVLAMVAFTVSYAEAPVVLHPRVRHSSVVRTFEERAILSANTDKIITLSLRGYVFFGSAVKILNEIKENVLAGHASGLPETGEREEEEEAEADIGGEGGVGPDGAEAMGPLPFSSTSAAMLFRGSGERTGPKARRERQGKSSIAASAPPCTGRPNPFLGRVRSTPRLVPDVVGRDRNEAKPVGEFPVVNGKREKGGRDAEEGPGHTKPQQLTSSASGRGGFPGIVSQSNGRSLGGSGPIGEASASSCVPDVLTPVYHRGGVWVETKGNASSGSALSWRRDSAEEELGEGEDSEEEDWTMRDEGCQGLNEPHESARGRPREEARDRSGPWMCGREMGRDSPLQDEIGSEAAPLLSCDHSHVSQHHAPSQCSGMAVSYDTAQDFMDSLENFLSPSAESSPDATSRSAPSSPAVSRRQQARVSEQERSEMELEEHRGSTTDRSHSRTSSSSLSAALAAAECRGDGTKSHVGNQSSELVDFYLREWSEDDRHVEFGQADCRSCSRGSIDRESRMATVAPSLPCPPPSSARKVSFPSSPAQASGSTVPQNRIRWLIFDFSQVVGIDATAARSCFLMLKSLLKGAHIRLIFASPGPVIERLLRGHGVLDEEDSVFDSVDEALEYCEEELLQSAAELSDADLIGLSRHPSFYAAVRRSRRLSRRAPKCSRRDKLLFEAQKALDLESILADYLEVAVEEGIDTDDGERGADAKVNHQPHRVLAQYFEEASFQPGECLFAGGEASDKLYFIRKGVIELRAPTISDNRGLGQRQQQRLQKISAGGTVGELGFFLKRPQIFTAMATTPCVVYFLTRPRLVELAKDNSKLACVLIFAVIKSIALASSYAISDFADVTLLLKCREDQGELRTPVAIKGTGKN
jgi:MFS superfamily sulfate permease-like transporter